MIYTRCDENAPDESGFFALYLPWQHQERDKRQRDEFQHVRDPYTERTRETIGLG